MPEPNTGTPRTSSLPRQKPPASIWRDGRGAFALVFRSPLSLFIIVPLTFVTALLSLFETGLQGLAFLHPSPNQLWYTLIALAPTTWVTSIFLMLGDFERYRSVWPRTRRDRMTVVLCLIALALLLALPVVAQFLVWRDHPGLLPGSRAQASDFLPKMIVMSFLALWVWALNASAMMSVHLQLLNRLPRYQPPEETTGAESLDEDVRWFQQRQADLRLLLRLLAAFLGVEILSMSASRNLINATLDSSTEPLPIAPVISYGLFLTGLLASLYVPAYRTLKKVGLALADRLVWQPLGAQPTWKQRLEEQQAIRTQLGLQSSALEDLQQGLTLLAPFLASIASLVFDIGG